MDVDLSTGLEALLPLVAPLISGHSDLAIGTRLARGARVVRGPKRELISRTYNRLLHLTLRSRFSDAQCGFKAGRAEAIKALLPAVEDEAWFFDTELLVLAERRGLRIHEVPVDWVDDPDSSVAIVPTAVADLRGIARLYGELMRFAVVGVASTVLYFAALPRRCARCSRRSPPTRPRWGSRRSPTPPPTGASPSAGAVARGCSATTSRACSSSASACC